MRPTLLLALAACCLVASGCGTDRRRTAISGTVKLDGTPIAEGSIQFIPSDPAAGPTAGAPIKNGAYSIAGEQGPVIGSNKVEIRSNRKTGKKVPDAAQPGSMREALEEAIPAAYNSKTTLVVDIKPGVNIENFDLKTKK